MQQTINSTTKIYKNDVFFHKFPVLEVLNLLGVLVWNSILRQLEATYLGTISLVVDDAVAYINTPQKAKNQKRS